MISALMLGIFWTLEKALLHIQDIFFFPVVNHCIRTLTQDVVHHIHLLPLEIYKTLSMPEILSAVRRISHSVRSFFKIFFLLSFPTTVKFFIALWVVMRLQQYGFILAPILILSLLCLYKGLQWYLLVRTKAWRASDQVFLTINDSLYNSVSVRSHLRFSLDRIAEHLNEEAHHWQNTNVRMHLVHIGIIVLFGAVLTLFLALSVQEIINKTLSIGNLVLIQGQIMAAFLPLKTLTLEFRQLAESMVDITKIADILELKKHTQKDTDNPLLLNPNACIQCADVQFYYESNSPIFTGLNLNIFTGDTIGVVGHNGSGKSTFTTLLAGLLKPISGSIYLNQKPIHAYTEAERSHNILVIPQEARLFNQTVLENLTFGLNHSSRQEVDEEEIWQALNIVGLETLIKKLPNGLHTRQGEMGTRFSGGEKQRLLLARALLLSPEILILDESLHAIAFQDAEKILSALMAVIQTVILVSHNPRLLSKMHRIIKIEHGKIKEIDKSSLLADNATRMSANSTA